MSYLNKTSLLVPSQLPEFIRDDASYETFVLFLQAYYEWMEEEGGALYGSKNLTQYYDIDTTLDDFLKYYENQFLSFFPEGSLVDERKLTKIARELYQNKGVPASFKFLFRILYNTDVELYNTKDYVFRASDGKWVATRSLKLSTIDPKWLNTVNYRLFGETSFGYATVEDVIIGTNYTQVVLSGIDRNFTSGEFVTVVDIHGAPVLFNGNPLTAQIIGVLSSVTPDPVNNGAGYNIGDPVVFYGGLNPNVQFPVGASGYISQVSSASVTGVTPTYGGQGYRPGGYTTVSVTTGSGTGNGASDIATTFDTANPFYIYLVNNDTIGPKANIHLNSGSYQFANLFNANINSTLLQALSFPVLNTFGILTTTVTSGGSGYDATTTANATGYYQTDVTTLAPLTSVGMLAPMIITSGGTGYALNDTITFTGGSGTGAYANVTGVLANGQITHVDYHYNYSRGLLPLGGMGYQYGLPSVTINSANGAGAILTIPGIVGGDAKFSIQSTTYGQVQGIYLTNPGQDYISEPSISLRVEDLLVYNVDIFNEPKRGDVIYQGPANNKTFVANVDSISTYTVSANTALTTYNLRVYDYSGLLDTNNSIRIARSGVDLGTSIRISNTTTGIYTNGRKIYGNGAAKAKANFLNGVVLNSGVYQNADGQPSAYSVLEDTVYNNYTYILQVQESLSKFKNTALSFLHPAGMNYQSYNLLKNEQRFHSYMDTAKELNVQSLAYLFDGGGLSYSAQLAANSSNTIVFSGLTGANVVNVVSPNSYITINSPIIPNEPTLPPFYSTVKSVTANTITFADNWVTVVPNVAVATASAGSNTINIINLTDSWTIATGNVISYANNFMRPGYDYVSFDNGNTYQLITQVYEDIIRVNVAYGTAQSGYITFKQNTISSNIWVSGIVETPEVIDVLTESGQPLTTEDGTFFILG
jgi:hypothetical protein